MLATVLPVDRVQRVLFLLFLMLLAASLYDPPYGDFMLMQHAPTLLGGAVLVWVSRRYPMSRLSFTLVILFLCLHTIGARYLYSYVPYDSSFARHLGLKLNEVFGFERNHYDRLVHFCFGLLLAVPIQEFERRHLQLSSVLASVLAIECILATSAAYELIEWLVAVVFTPEWADQFLGQQGDPFDAQKDTALAVVGAFIAIGLKALVGQMRSAKGTQ